MENKVILIIVICGIIGAVLGYMIIGLPYMNQRIEDEYGITFAKYIHPSFFEHPRP